MAPYRAGCEGASVRQFSKVVRVDSNTVFLTIISQNYVPQARCLMESLRAFYPGARRVICLVEEDLKEDLFDNDVEVLLAKDLVGRSFLELAYKYSIVELNTAVKPFVLRALLQKEVVSVTYIDPDCFLFSPLEEVFALLQGGSNIVLTPHATHPINDEGSPGEIDFLRAGTFNLGFISVRNSPVSLQMLDWWADRLRNLCVFDPMSGLFVDQKWMDLAPSFFDGVTVLRHPGYNVAYWNAFQRKIERMPGGWHVDGVPLRFFHFSGLPVEDVGQVSKHQTRLNGESIGPFVTEFHTYLARMASNALKPGEDRVYSYSLYWRGKPIESQALRSCLRRHGSFKPEKLAEFRDERPIAEMLKPHPDLPVDEMFPISRLIYDALIDSPVLCRHFSLFTGAGRAAFFYWVITEGHSRLQIDHSLLPWRELTTPVAGALGDRFAVPPMMWLLWMSDPSLRRKAHFASEESYARLLIEMQKQISEGDRPCWLLTNDYLRSVISGEGDNEITVAQYAVWLTRPDLRSAFDIDNADGRSGLIEWCTGPSPATELPWMARAIGQQNVEEETA